MPRWLGVVICVLTAALVVGCGRSPSNGNAASGERSPAAQPSAGPTAFAFHPGDCTLPFTGGNLLGPAPDTFGMAIKAPLGWKVTDMAGTDADFSMTAPDSYGHQPTTIGISGPLPTDQGIGVAAFLARYIQGFVTVTIPPQECKVGSDSAAFLSFSHGGKAGFIVTWFHFGDAYLMVLEGLGGVDVNAVRDAKGVLASVTYTHNKPPPDFTPSPA